MLRDILAPLSPEEFFREFWSREFLHIPGPAGKFSHYFPWEALNEALEQHRFDPRRLLLVKSGLKIDPGRYLNGNRVDAQRIINELSSGATLIFNGCDEVQPALRDLCVHLERLLHHRVVVNLYAGWRRDSGFNVHWDDHNTIILQVAGRKQWKVWKPTRKYPLRDDVPEVAPARSAEPVWDHTLEPGGLLSIPRGWWHVAHPPDEPSLHLTVSLSSPTGIDLLRWLAEQMKSSETARMDLPVLAGRSERTNWTESLRADLLALLDGNPIDRYLAELDSKTVARPRISLPADMNLHRDPLRRTTLLELAAPFPLHFSIQHGKTVCSASGMSWQMNAEVAERLRAFNDGCPHAIGELFPVQDVRDTGLLGVMVMKGVLRRVSDSPNGNS
jgi:ribosomal protein L16 Arg81 hydroxylase